VDIDRALFGVAPGEVGALQHARYRVLGAELDHLEEVELLQPLGVVSNLRLVFIQDLEGLRLIGLGGRQHVLSREARARFTLAGRVAHHGGEIADQKDDLMAQLLELTHLFHQHRVAEVQVGARRIETRFHAQRLAASESLLELLAHV